MIRSGGRGGVRLWAWHPVEALGSSLTRGARPTLETTPPSGLRVRCKGLMRNHALRRREPDRDLAIDRHLAGPLEHDHGPPKAGP